MRYVVEAKVSDRMYDQFLNLSFAHYDDKKLLICMTKRSNSRSFFSYVFDRIARLFAELITMVAGVAALATVKYMASTCRSGRDFTWSICAVSSVTRPN
jgi:hypothetical protein